MNRFAQVLRHLIAREVARQHGHWLPWVPVCVAIGIGVFFSLKFEPSPRFIGAIVVFAFISLCACRYIAVELRPMMIGVACVAIGFVIAGLRAGSVAAPVLETRYYGPIEGRIVAMDRSGSDAVRLTLDHVKLDGVGPGDTPTRVRVSLHGDRSADINPAPGLIVMTTGHLGPPDGPVEPGGFDFQRHAWFLQLGAVGYSRVPLLALAEAEQDFGTRVFEIRMALSNALQQRLPGDIGGVAAAIITGDRSGVSQAVWNDLRAANTAHLLAISGLHMGLLSGFVFAVLRLALALIPHIALRFPTRKIAATGALCAAGFYLLLSGGNVATERAFVMVAVALVAIILDRRALTLRAVAVAAIIILLWQPEALLGPGFQMSFAATTALVAVYSALRDVGWLQVPKYMQAALGLVVSSGVAGLATAPVGAAHFNAIAQYGLLANLVSVPLMGAVIIPAAVVSALLVPLGLEAIALWAMGIGLEWVLLVADWVAGLPGARRFVSSPPGFVLPIIAFGGLVVVLWQGCLRLIGLVIITFGFVMWNLESRPDILISGDASLVGVQTPAGRALSRERGAGFVARSWLENDGMPLIQDEAHRLWMGAGLPILHIRSRGDLDRFQSCDGAVLAVFTNVPNAPPDCAFLTSDDLRLVGAIAIYVDATGPRVRSVRDKTGSRMWSSWPAGEAPDLMQLRSVFGAGATINRTE